MSCPRCGHGQSLVRQTREGPHGITLRRRECTQCAKRFTTFEVLTGHLDRRRFNQAQAGKERRMSAWQLRQAVLKADPLESAERLGKNLGCSGARVRQIRSEHRRQAEQPSKPRTPRVIARDQALGMWGGLAK